MILADETDEFFENIGKEFKETPKKKSKAGWLYESFDLSGLPESKKTESITILDE